jgi:phage-related protein
VARPGGKEVGRVNIRAVPDGTKFRRDLKVMLDRVERTVDLSLPVTADTRFADSALQRFQKEWNGQQVTLGAGVATSGARASLALLTRPRFVELIVRVSKASAVKAAAVISALSGLRVTGDLIDKVVKKLGNLDRALPKIALVAASVSSALALVLSSIGGLTTLGNGLGQIFGLLAVLPASLAGAASGGVALGLALVDVKKQLGSLAPGFKRLQDNVSASFWAQARKPIIDFVNRTLPQVDTGLQRTASAVGRWTRNILSSLQQAFGGARIQAMFDSLVTAINIASTGAQGFVQIIAVLGQVGGSYLPRLAQWVADLSNQFGAYLLQIEASGELTRIIDSAITGAQLLGSSLGSILSILGGISSAAESAGGGGLASFAAILASIAAAVNSPAFQTTLATIFSGAASGVSGLADALQPIGQMLSTLAPIISNILAGAGATVGSILGQIATALQSPAFQTGLGVFFEGLLDGLNAVAPALPALADALGAFLSFAGRLASSLGPVLGAALQALAPVFIELLSAIDPSILGDALVEAFQNLAPSLLELAQVIAPLLPDLLQLVADLLPQWVLYIRSASNVLQALMPVLTPVLDGLTYLSGLAAGLFEFGNALLNGATSGEAALGVLGGKFGPELQALGSTFTRTLALVQAFFRGIGDAVTALVGWWGATWDTVSGAFSAAWNGIIAAGKGAFNILAGLAEGLVNSLIDGINGLLSGLRTVLQGLKQATGIDLTFQKMPHVRLPRLEVGADILPRVGGTAAILAEGGRPETVTDLGRTNRLIALANRLAEQALANGGRAGGNTFNIQSLDFEELVQMILRRLQFGDA